MSLAKVISKYSIRDKVSRLLAECLGIKISETNVKKTASIELLSGKILGRIPFGEYTYYDFYYYLDKILACKDKLSYIIYLDDEQLTTNRYYRCSNMKLIDTKFIFDLLDIKCAIIRIINVIYKTVPNSRGIVTIRNSDTRHYYHMTTSIQRVSHIYSEEQYNIELIRTNINSETADMANIYLQNYLNDTTIKIPPDLQTKLLPLSNIDLPNFKTLEELCNKRAKYVSQFSGPGNIWSKKMPVIATFYKHFISRCLYANAQILNYIRVIGVAA